MACVNCDKIRSAILHGKMAEAAGLTVEALREKFGLTGGDDKAPATGVVGESAPEPILSEKSAAKAK